MLTLRYADLIVVLVAAFMTGMSVGVAGFGVWLDRQIKSGKLRRCGK
jgi:hypothetical protein